MSLFTILRSSLVPLRNIRVQFNNFSSVAVQNVCGFPKSRILEQLNCNQALIQSRSVTKFSIQKGKRKSVKTVLDRFYRLNWGGWIRTIAGRKKHLWKKTSANKRRLRQHVLCNATQCTLLDKMVTNFWRKPKYYVDDPYEPYHTREEFKFTYKIPKPYFPKE